MRSSIYVMTVLAAAGIAYYLASSGAPEPQAATAAITEATPAAFADAGTLTLRVDDMHCEYGCYPKVKKTLEGFEHVVSVELDEQGEEGMMDNPQVLLTYQAGFDLAAAQSALAKNGFAKSSVVP